jgi:hypothetical protein
VNQEELTPKCDHNAVHKEVLGHVLCVCCTHCQKELEEKNRQIKELVETLEKIAGEIKIMKEEVNSPNQRGDE